MDRYKYRAINEKGRPVKGLVSANSEVDLYKQLQSANLELLSCSKVKEGKGLFDFLGFGAKITTRDLIQFFMHLDQMQGAGVPLLDALADIRDTTDHDRLRDVMAEIHRDVSDGSSLSESMSRHPKVFTDLHTSLVGAGEETGDMTGSYQQLVKYLKWVDAMQTKIRKATRYPIIVTVVVTLTVVVMMTVVVPQIVSFIRNLDQDLPFYTTSLVATSDFFVDWWWAVLAAPVLLFFFVRLLAHVSEDMAYRFDLWALGMPIAGPLIRKINIARFAQTFSALFASGIDVLYGLEAAQKTVGNRALQEALAGVREQVKSGSPLSEALNGSGEFPSMTVRMVKVGEESGNLTVVLEQVSDFYTADVDEAVQGLITMIEPALTGVLGIMILWIAVGVFGPIYESFENIDF